MPFLRRVQPRSWIERLIVAAGSMACALVLTHALWTFIRYTPFLFAFAASILSSRLGGRWAALFALVFGVAGFVWFPPPLAAEGFAGVLAGFVIVSGAFTWIVARRYEIEAELRISQERLHAVTSSLPLVVWALDREGRVLFAEGGGFELDGLKPKELVGCSVFEQYRDQPDVIANTRRVLEGDTFNAVVTIGDVVVETWCSPLRDEHGVVGAIGVSLDVTTRRRLEEQYFQAQKMEAVGQLAAGIAHDFNNLLVAIGGYAELVTATLDPSDVRHQDLIEIRKASERAAVLTRQLLALSRRQILHTRVLDVNRLVGNVEKLLRRTIGEDIDLVLDLSSSVDPVRVDANAIEHALLNLALNARDAMPSGGQLRFTTENVERDHEDAAGFPPMTKGRYVRLRVADTGIGMTPEIQARMFEPFFTTKGGNKGTGLGLATVYGVIRQMGGFISVDSEVGLGTVISISFPSVHEPVETTDNTRASVPVSGGSETILITEDDGAVRRLAADVLRKWGYTVLVARDGEEALAAARAYAGPIHLLITDIVMPGLGGRPLAGKLTMDRPGVRVLYTSGYGGDVTLRTGTATAPPFLAKPFLPLELIRTVREVLDPTPGSGR
jgi:two-component system cell cycle sensor histidine kinase/response regulator CckA